MIKASINFDIPGMEIYFEEIVSENLGGFSIEIFCYFSCYKSSTYKIKFI